MFGAVWAQAEARKVLTAVGATGDRPRAAGADGRGAVHRARRAARRRGARSGRSRAYSVSWPAWPKPARRPPSGVPPADVAGSARTRRCPGRRRPSCDLTAASRARLARSAVNEELVLEGAAGAVGVAEVVDRGASAASPACSDATTASRIAAHWARVSRLAGRSGWIAGSEERLVGVDVAHPRDPLLIEQEGLDRRAGRCGQREGARP